MKSLIPFSLVGMLLFFVVGCGGAGARGASSDVRPSPRMEDPVLRDLAFFDAEYPPILVEAQFVVDGARMNAIVYEAQGIGPHPTVILLHGFPGNERNLDLAQAIRRSGWNVVFFHYRGAWGSEGVFSFEHILEDVVAVVGAVSEKSFASSHRIDPNRIALVGHSMGGFAALISGASLPAVDCIVSIAGANLGGLASAIKANPARVEALAERLDSWSGPIKGLSGKELVSEVIKNADRFDTIRAAASLAPKRLLLIAGENDVVTPPSMNHLPLVDALRTEGAGSLAEKIIKTADHSFSGSRIALAWEVTDWLERTCHARGAQEQ